MTTVAIPFVQVGKDQNPNLRARTDDAALRTYLHAAFICLASVRRWNPMVKLEFVTNAPLPHDFVADLKSIDGSVRTVSFEHVPPAGYATAFKGCFYLLDAIEAASDSDMTIFIDPDVVCLGSLGALADRCANAVGVLRMNYEPSKVVNGLSAESARALHLNLGEADRTPVHYGGELYIIPASSRLKVVSRANRGWQFSLEEFAEGRAYFPTEEHILNFALRGVSSVELNDLAKRVWTAHSFRTVDGEERALTLWHLPAEKNRGFPKLLGPVRDRDSWFWRAPREEFAQRMERVFGLRKRSAKRFLLDSIGSVRRQMMGLG